MVNIHNNKNDNIGKYQNYNQIKPVLYNIASFFNDDRQQKTVGLDYYPQYLY